MGTRKNGRTRGVSLARPVLSGAHLGTGHYLSPGGGGGPRILGGIT